MSTQPTREQRLAALLGKSVAVQANAGYSHVWKRSELFQSVKTDDQLMDFADVMSQIVSENNDAKMQEFYQAIDKYYNDPGHKNSVPKIQECLELAVTAMAVDKVSVQVVAGVMAEGQAKRALNGDTEASRTEVVADTNVDPDLPPLPKLVGDHLTKEEFVASIFKPQVWYLTWPQSGTLVSRDCDLCQKCQISFLCVVGF